MLWHSFGSIAALLQEVINVYPAINPPTLSVIIEKSFFFLEKYLEIIFFLILRHINRIEYVMHWHYCNVLHHIKKQEVCFCKVHFLIISHLAQN